MVFFEITIHCVMLALFKEIALCVMSVVITVMSDNKTIRLKYEILYIFTVLICFEISLLKIVRFEEMFSTNYPEPQFA